ncbi:S8 family serine peptidase [Lysobacter sp. cf310]|uniref:S8 family serine peptidase n=1 Tax=Lysobacter sp. cf310 TaxID=1761790 RepID=UPI0008EFE2CB|nr:S8 family serine peptidase [Lysobacter sp. cf310]SFL29568.1 Subtilase family protein [Lysobacter sp. cf310]
MKRWTLAVCAAALAAGNAHAATYVVQAKAQNFSPALAAKIAAAGGQVKARYAQIGVAIVEADDSFAARALQLGEIESASRDRVLQFEQPTVVSGLSLGENAASPPNTGDNDTRFDLQWGHTAIRATDAWARGYRGVGAVVAVLDSGVDCTHPDLVPNLLINLNASFVPGEGACATRPFPVFNHGTHVAGTIAAADNGIGIIGVAPSAKFFAVKVLSEFTGSGSFAGILQGILYATDNGADVINMSLGVSGGLPIAADTKDLIKAMQKAVLYARQNNTIVIASTGNDAIDFDRAVDADGNRLMSFPGGVEGVVGISATAPIGWALNFNTNLDIPTSYTNYGKHTVHFAAPGGDSVYPGNENCTVAGLLRPCWVFDLVFSDSTGGFSWAGGTSMASPHAAGIAALIIGANGGDLQVSRVENALRQGAADLGTHGVDEFFGQGRVNADDSLR